MKILIIGSGNVGKALAKKLRDGGHTVVGTTTTPSKVELLVPNYMDEAVVLLGSETDKVIAAAKGCDAIVASIAPDFKKATNRENREGAYNDVLVKSCASAKAACPRVIFCSSFSVYGDGGDGTEPIDESTPTANNDEPSSKYYQLAEKAVLSDPAGGCVLRYPDMYGAPGDYSFVERVKLAHQFMGGAVPFAATPPYYRIHYMDVVDSVMHALTAGLEGTFNVNDDTVVPDGNQVVMDELCEMAKVPKLKFKAEITMPERAISAAKLRGAGFACQHTTADIIKEEKELKRAADEELDKAINGDGASNKRFRLVYFDSKGRAELSRLVLAQSATPYDDVRLNFAQWGPFKAAGKAPFGQLPVLEVDGATVSQSMSIARFLARECGLMGKTAVEGARIEMVTDQVMDLRTKFGPIVFEKDEAAKAAKFEEFFTTRANVYSGKPEPGHLPTFLKTFEAFLAKEESGFLVGGAVSLADLALYDHLAGVLAAAKEIGKEGVLTEAPAVAALVARVAALPRIAAWLAARPKTQY